jgi:hypothetical protein
MSPNTPNFDTLSLHADDLATKYVAHRYCVPLTVAAIIAASAGIGEHGK